MKELFRIQTPSSNSFAYCSPTSFLRHLSESTPGLDDSGCRASHLNAVSLTSTKAVPLSLSLSILHSFETTSSILETVSVTVEGSEFVNELVQLLGWLTTRSLEVWSISKSMSNSCTPPGPSAHFVRGARESQIHRIYYKAQKFYFLTWLKHRFL